MNILITGGTGFIGTALIRTLAAQGHSIVLLTRGPSGAFTSGTTTVVRRQWDPLRRGEWMTELGRCDVVINLVGKNLFEQRWNARVKQQILESRVAPLQLIAEAIGNAAKKPSLLISASAVGYYGDRGTEPLTETSTGADDFLGDVVRQWEGAAQVSQKFGVRVATPRIGLVLGKEGGMIGTMLLPFRMFVGGPVGSGDQFLPWVHMEDVVRGLLLPMERPDLSGPYNLVAPNPVTMRDFARQFGAALHRPSWIPVPGFALSLLYGEGAKAILAGQKVIPAALQSAGFEFTFPLLGPALADLLASR